MPRSYVLAGQHQSRRPVASPAGPPSRGSIRFRAACALVLSFLPHRGAVAQLVARLVRNEKVRGSNPLSSTRREPRPTSGNAAGRAGFRRCHWFPTSVRVPPVYPGAFRRSKPARSDRTPTLSRQSSPRGSISVPTSRGQLIDEPAQDRSRGCSRHRLAEHPMLIHQASASPSGLPPWRASTSVPPNDRPPEQLVGTPEKRHERAPLLRDLTLHWRAATRRVRVRAPRTSRSPLERCCRHCSRSWCGWSCRRPHWVRVSRVFANGERRNPHLATQLRRVGGQGGSGGRMGGGAVSCHQSAWIRVEHDRR